MLLATTAMTSITGTVTSVKNPRAFILENDHGRLEVLVENSQSVVLKEGDQVTVTGALDKSWLGTKLHARQITVQKGIVQTLSDAVKGAPGLPTSNAQPYDIGRLPASGKVKLTGTVTAVRSDTSFMLEDATGRIHIDVASAERAAITPGARVSVIGKVNNSLLHGRQVKAYSIIVLNNRSQ